VGHSCSIYTSDSSLINMLNLQTSAGVSIGRKSLKSPKPEALVLIYERSRVFASQRNLYLQYTWRFTTRRLIVKIRFGYTYHLNEYEALCNQDLSSKGTKPRVGTGLYRVQNVDSEEN
jgi:hypothetical protein